MPDESHPTTVLPLRTDYFISPATRANKIFLCQTLVKSTDSLILVTEIANIFRASIIDVSVASLTLAVIGDESKAEAIQNLLREFGILELVRTGMVALERGQFTIDEQTKVKGEYDYGKNVL